jgi:hypothetical protein
MIDCDSLPEAKNQQGSENKKIAHDKLMARADIKAQVYRAIVEKPITMKQITMLPANHLHHTYSTSFREWAEAGLVAKDSKNRIYCLIPGTPSNQAVIEQGTFIEFRIAPKRVVSRNSKQHPKVNASLNNNNDIDEKAYIPTKADCEEAIEELRHINSISHISENEVLNRLETNFKNNGITMKDNWKYVTKVNFKIWFS